MKEYQIAIVTWEDHHHDCNAWTKIEDLDNNSICINKTVGFIVHEDEKSIFLAFNFDEGLYDDMPKVSNRMRIIKSCIRNIEKVKLKAEECNKDYEKKGEIYE